MSSLFSGRGDWRSLTYANEGLVFLHLRLATGFGVVASNPPTGVCCSDEEAISANCRSGLDGGVVGLEVDGLGMGWVERCVGVVEVGWPPIFARSGPSAPTTYQ